MYIYGTGTQKVLYRRLDISCCYFSVFSTAKGSQPGPINELKIPFPNSQWGAGKEQVYLSFTTHSSQFYTSWSADRY